MVWSGCHAATRRPTVIPLSDYVAGSLRIGVKFVDLAMVRLACQPVDQGRVVVVAW